MRAYVIVVGVVFGLLAVVHIWRMAEEPRLASDPVFLLLTLAAASLSVGAFMALRRAARVRP
jgi:hypothetical protein